MTPSATQTTQPAPQPASRPAPKPGRPPSPSPRPPGRTATEPAGAKPDQHRQNVRKSRLRKLNVLLLALLLGAATTVIAVRFWDGWRPLGRPSGLPDITAPVAPGKRLVFAAGVVEGAQRQVPLRFEVTGRLAELLVREGETIKRDQLLARLDQQAIAHQVEQAQADLQLAQRERQRLVNGASPEELAVAKARLDVARTEVEYARRELVRASKLVESKAISDQEWENRRHAYMQAQATAGLALAELKELEAPAREDDLSIAEARIAIAQAKLKQSQDVLEKTHLRAPSDGVVLRVTVEPGQLTGPDAPDPVITVVDTSDWRVRAYVDEFDAALVKPGQRVTIRADGRPDTSYAGTISACSPVMIPKPLRSMKADEMVDVKVREVIVELEEHEGLVFGLPVDVFIDPGQESVPAMGE